MRRTCLVPEPFLPFGGFEYERRTKPLSTIARKKGTVAGKLNNAIHVVTLEAGKENLAKVRECCRGYCRDQGGAERGTAKAPVGERAAFDVQLAQVPAGTLSMAEFTQASAFWPNSLEHSDMCHIMQNAIQEAIEPEAD